MVHVPLQLRLVPDPASARLARQFARKVLAWWRLTSRLPDVLLLVTELVENALRHTHRPCVLQMDREGSLIEVSVVDLSPETLRTDAEPGHLEPGGRGLLLVNKLSESWGVTPTAEGGKVVWARIAA